jgi:hypothetical protein
VHQLDEHVFKSQSIGSTYIEIIINIQMRIQIFYFNFEKQRLNQNSTKNTTSTNQNRHQTQQHNIGRAFTVYEKIYIFINS